jgi:release factor glutamine methyltransferase
MTTDRPWTIGRLLEWTSRHFKGKGIDPARLEAELLLAHALCCSRTSLYTSYEEVPAEDKRGRFRELVQQRLEGRPVAHLRGRKEFFSLDFEVGPDVLVPRPDSEWIVTECLSLAKSMIAPTILDIGTGSGCLAVAVAAGHKGAVVTAIDISEAALKVARRNAERHHFAERIRFLHGDLFAPLSAGERFDFILCNPPYIPRGQIETLAPEVRDHEPRLALDGGEDGFAVIDRLIAGAGAHLQPGGHLILEIGFDQEEESRRRFAQHPSYELGKTIHDHAGHPRVLRARCQMAGLQ